MNYKEQIEILWEEQKLYRDAFDKYNEIERQIKTLRNKFQNECKHEDAYWFGQDYESYEGRTYDKIYCPVCGKTWEERVYAGRHEYQSEEEYLNKNR